MGCFSLLWLEQLLIDLVVICAVVAVIRLLVPWVLSKFGGTGSIIARIIDIVLWAIVAIFVIIVVFQLLSCLLGAGGFAMFQLPHAR
jgi:hypothetical protein